MFYDLYVYFRITLLYLFFIFSFIFYSFYDFYVYFRITLFYIFCRLSFIFLACSKLIPFISAISSVLASVIFLILPNFFNNCLFLTSPIPSILSSIDLVVSFSLNFL